MSRHGGRGADGAYGDGTWLPGGYAAGPAEDDESRRRGSTQTSDSGSQTGPPWEDLGPPWEQAGWDDTGGPRPGHDPADLAGQHPSDPLPSLPLQPHEGDWPEPPAAFGYPDDGALEPGYPGEPGAGYPGGHDDDTGYGYGGYDGTGYEPGGYPGAGYGDTGTGFPAVGGDTGTGYAHPAYGEGRFSDDAGPYHDDGGYPAGGDDGYPAYGGPTAGHPDPDDDHGYPGREGWYEDTGQQRGWAEDDEGDFLPGMSPGAGGGGQDGRDGTGQARTGSGKPGKPGKTRKGRGSGGTAKGGKRKSGMRRLAPWLALSVVLALLIGAGAGYFYVYRTYLHPPDFAGQGTGSKVVRIFPGDTASVVGVRLQREGVIASARAFSNAAKASGQGRALEPGYYRVRLHMNAALAFALLLKPSARVQSKITIPEGLRLTQIIATLGRATGNPQGYRQAIKNVSALNLPSFAHGNPEGYLFPATYDVQPNTPPAKVLQQMVIRFGQEAASVSLPAAAAHAEITQADVIIVASLIQAEGRPADFPKVARVIYNRLNANPQIPLQLDSTVMYALHTHGVRASAQQIRVNSPYNTYRHTGLPPGPIDSPGDAAIKAALHPAHGTWMYFVTVDPKTGLTKFTSSFAQFQRFQAELTANLAKGR